MTMQSNVLHLLANLFVPVLCGIVRITCAVPLRDLVQARLVQLSAVYWGRMAVVLKAKQ